MIAGENKQGFVAAHWDWLAAGIAALALIGGAAFYFISAQGDPEEEAEEAVRALESVGRRSDTGVVAVEMKPYADASKAVKSPAKLAEVADKQGSFLVSKRRVYCPLCEAPIPDGLEKCPVCGKEMPKEAASLDKDGDGMPNEYELKYGLNPELDDREDDKDGDDFSNWEEFVAKTDPSDPKSHPDYLDSLKLELPLMETTLPFYFNGVRPLPGNKFRHEFFDPSKKNDHGKKGLIYSVLEGEEIGKSGFVVKGYEKKEERRKIKGSGLEKMVDVSEVTIERQSDKKKLVLQLGEKRKAVDVQAKLVYDRRGIKEFVVVPGDSIELNGTKYKVLLVKRNGKGAEVLLENVLTSAKKSIQALE